MASRDRTLSALARLVSGRVTGAGDPVVEDVTHDSRAVTPGAMYVALRGANADGHRFVGEAETGGAVAVCVDHDTGARVPQLVVDDTRAVLGDLAAAIHDRPSSSLAVIGVTGTNGKTTVTHYIESIAGSCGVVTGLIGTIHTRFAGHVVESSMTTPEASEFQRLLGEMRDAGVGLVAVEVSSHALEFGRVAATRFAVAAFTNLSQDHLDFHGDMRSYRAAKERLFSEYEVGTAVINVDDPVGAAIAADYGGQLIRVGVGADVSVRDVTSRHRATEFTLDSPWGAATVTAPVTGGFNVTNLVMAAACCVVAGVDFGDVVAAMANVEGVPGRYEVVSGDDPIVVIVDYAHTPEAVATAVDTARGLGPGRVIGLIGAGGDRDRAKRPDMGSAISRADLAVVTSDNPRSEVPETIVAEVMAGVDPGSTHIVEIDRRAAIDVAIDAAEDGDVVLILGRGHEPYQQMAGERLPFDDRDVAAASLARRRGGPRNRTPDRGA
ncbi:MAG: UDP-N-acetylmuramoyl-L-alanyl-D-glutamate--2,6-diaminopimelate ligase [Acidimicrobiia bacterium]